MARPADDRIDGLVEEFAALPAGTVVRFAEGVDFTTTPGTFRNKLHRHMRYRGLLINTMLKGLDVYAKVTGPSPEAVADARRGRVDAAAPEPPPAPPGPMTNPFLPPPMDRAVAAAAPRPTIRSPFAVFAGPM